MAFLQKSNSKDRNLGESLSDYLLNVNMLRHIFPSACIFAKTVKMSSNIYNLPDTTLHVRASL
jgi:hypothetical protein